LNKKPLAYLEEHGWASQVRNGDLQPWHPQQKREAGVGARAHVSASHSREHDPAAGSGSL